MLIRLSRWCHRHRWIVLGGWVVALVAIMGASSAIGSAFSDQLEVPDSDTKRGFEIVEDHFDGFGTGYGGNIVFTTPDGIDSPEVVEAMTTMIDQASVIGNVRAVSPYQPEGAAQISDDGTIAYASIELDPDTSETEAAEIGRSLRDSKPDVDGLEVYVGGQLLSEFEPPESELIGLAFAVVILVVAFGSVVAMGLPIGVALVGVGTGLGLTTLASNGLTIPEFALSIGAMVGIGVGIDYALFIVTRYREHLHEGWAAEDASAGAFDTAGRAVVFAGLTVVISLMGLLVIGLQFVTGLALAASITVLCTMASSMTLLPALIAFAGERIEKTRWRGAIAAGFVALALFGVGMSIQPLMIGLPIAIIILLAGTFVAPLRRDVPRRAPRPLRETGWYRFSRVIQARPWTAAISCALLLLVLAMPVLGLRLGFSDDGNASVDTDRRQAYDLLSEGFGPGFNGTLVAAVDIGEPDELPVVIELVETLEATDGLAQVLGPIPDDPEAPQAALIRLVSDAAPQDEATADLIDRLRADVIPSVVEGSSTDVYLTGFTAASIDFSDYLAGRTLMFFGVVLLLSFLLLMMVFRSLLVPLKAVVMNALSIAAAYGLVVAVFQWGWLDGLLNTGQNAPIEPFIPMMMFAVVFGLSMDYEVFLLSRIKEEYDRSGDAVESVADGLAATARVISAAAAIMVVVFGSFLFESDRVIRLFGFGLAVAVLIDATIVRMVLVPATMELLGEKNWWIPRWLDRILPNIEVEGHAGPPTDGDGETASTEDDDRDDRDDPDPERVLVGV